jgi:hypothetical protein
MSHRINVLVDDDTWKLLEKVPLGERSRTINLALREWAARRRRRDAAEDMDRLREEPGLSPVSTAEIARWIRQDRDGAH